MKKLCSSGAYVRIPKRVIRRVFESIDFTPGGCWLMSGLTPRHANQPHSYQQVCWSEKGQKFNTGGHVIMARLGQRGGGPLKPDEEVHHWCREPSCGNPAHLEITENRREHCSFHRRAL